MFSGNRNNFFFFYLKTFKDFWIENSIEGMHTFKKVVFFHCMHLFLNYILVCELFAKCGESDSKFCDESFWWMYFWPIPFSSTRDFFWNIFEVPTNFIFCWVVKFHRFSFCIFIIFLLARVYTLSVSEANSAVLTNFQWVYA